MRLRIIMNKIIDKLEKNLIWRQNQIFIFYIKFTIIFINADESIAMVNPTPIQINIRIAFLSDFVSPHELMASYPAQAVSPIAITPKDRQRYLLIRLITENIVESFLL